MVLVHICYYLGECGQLIKLNISQMGSLITHCQIVWVFI